MWVIQKADREKKELRSPRDYFWEQERYTIQAGDERNLAVEKALARIESDYGRVIGDVRAGKQISPEQRVWLSLFAGAMLARAGSVPGRTERMLRTVAKQTRRLEEKRGAPPQQSADMEENVKSVHGPTASAGIIEYSKMFFAMNLSIFATEDEVGFITSDAPVFMSIPGVENQWHGNGRSWATRMLRSSFRCPRIVSRFIHGRLPRSFIGQLIGKKWIS